MPDFKPIPSHADWSTLKKKHGQGSLSVSGVDLGTSLDKFKSTVKAGLKNANANAAASQTLHETLVKYVSKLPKDSKRPKAFDDAVGVIRDNAKHNTEIFKVQVGEIAAFAHALQRFHAEAIRLSTSPDLNKLADVKKNDLLPPLQAAARKLDIEEFMADEVVSFNRTINEIIRQSTASNNMAALGEMPEIRIHAQHILAKLQNGLNNG